MLDKGFYSIVYSSGEYRTIRIKPIADGGLAGKTILSIKEGTEFIGCGFLLENNRVAFWNKFKKVNNSERLTRIERAVATVAANPQKHQQAYAMKEGKCARCGRALTVPASLHAGMGPECAGKGYWSKADNRLAFEEQRASL